jgi:Uma2 family endonuclease
LDADVIQASRHDPVGFARLITPKENAPDRARCYGADMSAAIQLPVRFSLQEFLSWEPGDGRRYELVDGQPRAMAPTSAVHGVLQAQLASRLHNHLRERGSACRVATNPGIIPALLSAQNYREPDIGVTCSPVRPGQLMLPDPVLLVEILSPGNQADTWSNVWTYTSIATVQDILILHSTRVAAELLRRTGDGGWPGQTTTICEGNLVFNSIDFAVPLAEIHDGTGLTG